MNQGIEIPDGCEARIVGNKVVFVPKEGEDERIRKEIVGFIDNVLKDKNVLLLIADRIGDNIPSMIPDWIAYLEKQKSLSTEETELNSVAFLVQLGYICIPPGAKQKPAEWSSEDEKIRKRIINILGNNTDAHEEGWAVYADEISWLEKQREQKPKLEIYTRTKSKSFMEPYMKGWNDAMEAIKKEQKPAESDAIKGGDFISDGKRVFLVLANVKERNLGETNSTFCEGRILGVDGVVYCDGDDFKNFKRATSDERAKFIHDLKVGVELKEHPAGWSEENEAALDALIRRLEGEDIYVSPHLAVKCLKSLRPQPKQEWSEEDEGMIDLAVAAVEDFYDKKNPIRVEIINFLHAIRPQPHWKPSEEQMKSLAQAVGTFATFEHLKDDSKVLTSLYNDLKKLGTTE